MIFEYWEDLFEYLHLLRLQLSPLQRALRSIRRRHCTFRLLLEQEAKKTTFADRVGDFVEVVCCLSGLKRLLDFRRIKGRGIVNNGIQLRLKREIYSTTAYGYQFSRLKSAGRDASKTKLKNAVDLFFVDSLHLIVRSDDDDISSIQRENA